MRWEAACGWLDDAEFQPPPCRCLRASQRERERRPSAAHGVSDAAPAKKGTFGHNFWRWRRIRVGLISKLCSFLRAVQWYRSRRASFSIFFRPCWGALMHALTIHLSTFVYAITFDGRVAQESASYQSCVVLYGLFSGTGRVALASVYFFRPCWGALMHALTIHLSTFVIAITFDGRVAQESASYQSCVVLYGLFSGTGRVALASVFFFRPCWGALMHAVTIHLSTFVYAITFDGRVAQESASY